MSVQAISRLRLGPTFLPDDVGDQRRKTRFHQALLRVGQAEVREDISTALFYTDSANQSDLAWPEAPCLLCESFHRSLNFLGSSSV
jgi:hypothetical protein